MANRPRILVVDDHQDLRELLVETLSHLDADVHEAVSGAEAVAQARALQPAVILMDVMMPGELDGLQACQLIKQDTNLRHLSQVIFVSARSHAEDRAAAVRVGGDGYFVKPYSPAKIVDAVAQALARAGNAAPGAPEARH